VHSKNTSSYTWGSRLALLGGTKIGASRRVLTFDTFPARAPKGELSHNFHYWTDYCDLAIEFQHEIAKHSKLLIVQGKQNWLLVREHIEKQEGVIVTRIPLFISSLKESISFYGEPAELLVVQAKATMAVKQIIIPSYHGEWLFYDDARHYITARMIDMTWNACAGIAGLNTVNTGYFEWKVTVNPKMTNSKPSILDRVIHLAMQEKDGHAIDEKIVREEFSGWICKNSSAVKPSMVPPLLSLTAPSMPRILQLLRHPPDYRVHLFDLEEHPKPSS
jgi:hypothetical protein